VVNKISQLSDHQHQRLKFYKKLYFSLFSATSHTSSTKPSQYNSFRMYESAILYTYKVKRLPLPLILQFFVAFHSIYYTCRLTACCVLYFVLNNCTPLLKIFYVNHHTTPFFSCSQSTLYKFMYTCLTFQFVFTIFCYPNDGDLSITAKNRELACCSIIINHDAN